MNDQELFKQQMVLQSQEPHELCELQEKKESREETKKEEVLRQIETVLARLRPMVQMDGGDIQFIKFEDGIVYIKMLGACVGCPMSSFTIKAGIEQALQAEIPTVQKVIPVQDDE